MRVTFALLLALTACAEPSPEDAGRPIADAATSPEADAATAAPDAGPPSSCDPAPAEVGVYADDAEIVALLEALPARAARSLPPPTVHNMGFTGYDSHKGPPGRDYSNAMVFAPERRTALYAGGSHGTYRANDVWEYHLGSNTWQMLFYPVGGNVGSHKAGLFALRRMIDRDETPDAETMAAIDAYVAWAREHTELRDGLYTTLEGGPIMPSHQWDGLTYDPRTRQVVWRMGAHQSLSDAAVAYVLEMDEAEVTAQRATDTTPMWTFDPETSRWRWYRHDGETPRSSLRGMGTTAIYVPDLCAVVHYAAAQNVTPPAFEMWSHDLAADTWTELHPNGGAAIRQLATADGLAPGSEQQTAYSPVARQIVAVLGSETYTYDIDRNEWAHLLSDERIDAHDARTVFAYDTVNDVFLLFDERHPTRVAALSLETAAWELIEVDGDPFPPPPWGTAFGYFDPAHGVFVIAGARNRGVWVFRYA